MNRWLSYSKLAIAQAIIGLNFVLAKLLMPYCPMNLLLFLPLALASMKYYVPMTDLTQLVLLIIYGTVGSSGFFIFWYQGLEHAPASIAALFTAVMPVSACVLGAWFLNETMTLYDLGGIALVIISIMLGSFTFKNLRKKTILFNDWVFFMSRFVRLAKSYNLTNL